MTKQRSDRKARKGASKRPLKNGNTAKNIVAQAEALSTPSASQNDECTSISSPKTLHESTASDRVQVADASSSIADHTAGSVENVFEEKSADGGPSSSSKAPRRSSETQAAQVATSPVASGTSTNGVAYEPMPQWVELKAIDGNTLFKLRPEGDVETLATSIVRSGQITPIDLRPKPGSPGRFQIVDGFRRVAAMKLIMRRRIVATVHEDLSDAEALSLAITALLEKKSASQGELESLKAKLESENRLTPMASEMLTQAIAPEAMALSPETIDCASPEPNPCELVDKILSQLGALNQDLNQLAKCWDQIPREVRDVILQQLGYSSEMARYFRRLPGGLF